MEQKKNSEKGEQKEKKRKKRKNLIYVYITPIFFPIHTFLSISEQPLDQSLSDGLSIGQSVQK